MTGSGKSILFRQAADAVRVLWMRPDGAGGLRPPEAPVPRLVAALIDAANRAPDEHAAGVVDYLNELVRRGDFATGCRDALFSALIDNGYLPEREESGESLFLLRHAAALLRFPAALADTLAGREPETLSPAALPMLCEITPPADDGQLRSMIRAFDPFHGGRVFRWVDGKLSAAQLDEVRAVEKFYGFPGVRRQFRDHFEAFAAGEPTVPLLISSLPGHGKTQMTLAHALKHESLTLILAQAAMLEAPLEQLIAILRKRSDRRFVVFFDDVEPDKLDWYTFRTHVGGAYALPANILLVAASNYEFPASILSRGCSVAFPTFDDVRCEEMVEDFLAQWGFRQANRNLISLIATRYTEEFGQKLFTELSPRTLMRYLHKFEVSRQKRMDMIQLSCGQMITKPDPELFYDFNLRLMRKLYGNEYIENMLKERLRAMEQGRT